MNSAFMYISVLTTIMIIAMVGYRLGEKRLTHKISPILLVKFTRALTERGYWTICPSASEAMVILEAGKLISQCDDIDEQEMDEEVNAWADGIMSRARERVEGD